MIMVVCARAGSCRMCLHICGHSTPHEKKPKREDYHKSTCDIPCPWMDDPKAICIEVKENADDEDKASDTQDNPA